MAAEKPEKKEKKDKKRSDESGVSKSKKDKKDKKEKKEKLAAAAEDELERDTAVKASAVVVKKVAAVEDDSDVEIDDASALPVERTVVPFAVPLADDKGTKKVFKTIRKSAKANTLKRGVKEVVKTLRKSPAAGPGVTSFPGIVIIAGDISPADVISHLPVLCEDHNVPFIFVSSRAELGAAAKTKRPTSVVMIMEKREGGKKKSDEKEEDGEEFGESYAALVKYVQKELSKQAFWSKGDGKAVA
ncbi:50S ribosomal protein L30e-like protein [Emericellopsis atlantica]|uniref:H/ACA ribonucleoprotein complex subunit 2 n=1 Tax=Emericellopsis atlantica TaxID=2614577 RepID=A0A9P8CQN7_9HYPO|nr:50S ribosomal protein L30e-like protein [Emericellopsis atlantica]KAG9255823.1 50S ribosomal protein L30e-like protein [Emericellopsis atlantica]